MRNILPWIIVALIVAASVVSCTVPYEVQPTPIEFTTIAKGIYSGVNQSSSEVIKDEATWAATWDSIVANQLEPEPIPQVDFNQYILLAHFMGQRPTSGYEVEFTDVLEEDNNISATVREVSPGSNCTVSQVITAPYDVIVIPKTYKPISVAIIDLNQCLIKTWSAWPIFHYNPQRTGVGQSRGIVTDSTSLRWSYSGGGTVRGIVGSPVESGGIIYFCSGDGKLYALNHDGTLKYSTQITRTTTQIAISSSPGLSQYGWYPRRLYIGTHEQSPSYDNFFAVDAETGNVIWSLQVPNGSPAAIKGGSSPLVVIDPKTLKPMIYVGAADGFLYCISDNGSQGVVVWRTQLQNADYSNGFYSSAAMSPVAPAGRLGTIYCAGQETNSTDTYYGWGKLFALDPYTGAIINAKTIVLTTTSGEWVSSPSVKIIGGVETIFAGTSDRQMRAVAIVSGSAVLAASNYGVSATISACPTICDLNGDGKVEAIFGDGAGWVHSITYDPSLPMGQRWDSSSSGSWKYKTSSTSIVSSAAVAYAPDLTVFVGGSGLGAIYSIKWDGTLLGSYGMPYTELIVTSSPAVAQTWLTALGWVFVGSCDNPLSPSTGKLYAFGPA